MVGGKRCEGLGYFVEPTVMVKTNRNMKVVREEIFGPVVVRHAVQRSRQAGR